MHQILPYQYGKEKVSAEIRYTLLFQVDSVESSHTIALPVAATLHYLPTTVVSKNIIFRLVV